MMSGSSRLHTFGGVAECGYELPHPQPVSLGKRELRVLFPLRWERARVRAAKDSHPKVILNTQQRAFGQALLSLAHLGNNFGKPLEKNTVL